MRKTMLGSSSSTRDDLPALLELLNNFRDSMTDASNQPRRVRSPKNAGSYQTLTLILKDGPTLPYDVICVVGEILAEDESLKTLAHLNVVSRTVHEETLRMLYCRMKLVSEGDFRWFVGKERPKGWQHTR
jgi:hypothetical protein